MSNSITFYEYASSHETCIPIIQRDYAQGRTGIKETQILQRFLTDIAKSLNDDKPLSLNFIYGMESGNDKSLQFLPIDGQQRLTTLFVFHWFVALKSGNLNDFLSAVKRFTYQTRSSAIDFFAELQNPDKITDFLKITKGSDISEFPWFKMDWSYDPTVMGILNAFDTMFNLFSDKEISDFDKWWDILTSKDNCKIVFKYVSINKGNTESSTISPTSRSAPNEFENEAKAALTYIKMNARGKHLSQFENAKALIHSLGSDGVQFVKDFDEDYVKTIESLVSQEKVTKNNIGELSRAIDDAMMNLLINLYNDLCLLIESKLPIADSYYKYMDILRNFHDQADKSEDEINYFKTYFELLKLIFMTNLCNSEEFADYIKAHERNRPSRLKFCLVLVYVWQNQDNRACLDEWKYLFSNLHYADERNTTQEQYLKIMQSIYVLALDMKNKNMLSPVEYMSKSNDSTPDFFNFISLDKGDWKEEHIKAAIIYNNKLAFNYFDKIEGAFNRRIRCFLYMANFWNTDEGDKVLLDSYINLAASLGLQGNNIIPPTLVKFYYLFATGFEGSKKSDTRLFVDSNVFNWKLKDEPKEQMRVLALVFDCLIKSGVHTCDVPSNKIDAMLSIIANELYNKNDWRAFVLTRDKEELFYHIEGDELCKSSTDRTNIFNYVKRLDVGGNILCNVITCKFTKDFGSIGTNTKTIRSMTITYNFDMAISIKISGINCDDYKFYTRDKTGVKLYRYIGKNVDGHIFDTAEFDISPNLNPYEEFGAKTKEALAALDNKIKTQPIYSKDYTQLENECKKIESNCDISIGSYYNTIITTYNIDININLEDKTIKMGREVLKLAP